MDKEQPCYLIIAGEKAESNTANEIQQMLVKGTVDDKINAMKRLIKLVINDDNFPKFLMQVLQYIAPMEEHDLKKLLLIYWDVVDKRKPDGTVKDEIILACNLLRKNLLHANEYIRGRTLKLMSKMMFKSLLEPIMQTIIENINHRHAYVRRNALACLFAIYVSFGNDMLQDVPDLLETLLHNESDISSKRNAFLLLYHCAEDRALNYLKEFTESGAESLSDLEDLMQLLIIELLRKSCVAEPGEKLKYLCYLLPFCMSKNNSVILECANSIVGLTKSRSALQYALNGYLRLLGTQCENNVILTVLTNLLGIIPVVDAPTLDQIGDILKYLQNESEDIREKAVNIVLLLAHDNTIDFILSHFKKLLRINKEDSNFVKLILNSINQLIKKFPSQTFLMLTIPMIEAYIDLGKGSDIELSGAYTVALFACNALEKIPELNKEIITLLIESLTEIKDDMALALVLWILGEHTESPEIAEKALKSISTDIGTLPLISIKKSIEIIAVLFLNSNIFFEVSRFKEKPQNF